MPAELTKKIRQGKRNGAARQEAKEKSLSKPQADWQIVWEKNEELVSAFDILNEKIML